MANTQNLASGILAEDLTMSATHLLVYVGDGGASTIKAVWPTAPFYITVMPHNPSSGVSNSMNSEIMKVTAVGNDQVGNVDLTIERAQKGTSANVFSAGDIVTNGIYVDDVFPAYSTSEVDTGYKWIDGRKIYRKTIEFGALPNTTAKTVNLNISNFGMFIQVFGMAIYSNGTGLILPFVGVSSSGANVAMNTSNDSIVITTNSDRSGANGYITAYYVKTS